MSEILEEYEEGAIKSVYKNRLFLKMTALGIVVILFAIYVGNVLFGKSSLDVLLNLQAQKEHLQKEVIELKEENAALQKQYFELKQLDPESK